MSKIEGRLHSPISSILGLCEAREGIITAPIAYQLPIGASYALALYRRESGILQMPEPVLGTRIGIEALKRC